MDDHPAAPSPHRHRGTALNPEGRFEPLRSDAVADGWPGDGEDDGKAWPTTVGIDATRSIIAHNSSPDLPFDQSINPYRGCEHGCIYCFARPSHGYLGLSAGLDFETRLFAKPDAAARLTEELRRPGYRPRVIAIGTNTDPYQPIERRWRVMRSVLEVLSAFRHPVSITTKSALVIRDIDLLAPMAALGLAQVGISVTSLDRDLARCLEPRAAVPERRLAAIHALAENGIPTMVMVAPVIPALTDHELERILEAAAAAGAVSASWALLRLPYEVKELFADWLTQHRPNARDRVLNRLRAARNGQLNGTDFGKRFTGDGPEVALLAKRFQLSCRRLGLGLPPGLRTDLFAPPAQPGDQLSLF